MAERDPVITLLKIRSAGIAGFQIEHIDLGITIRKSDDVGALEVPFSDCGNRNIPLILFVYGGMTYSLTPAAQVYARRCAHVGQATSPGV
jgi:hypothetical protein